MGDGRVALILDVLGCAQEAHIVAELGGARSRADHEPVSVAGVDERQSLLIVGVGADAQAAVPLWQVARLDEFPESTIERAGGIRMVQYRDEIVPLVDLADVVSGSPAPYAEGEPTVSVVVSTYRGRSVGLVVDRILDIVETQVAVDTVARRHGVLGTIVVQGRVTELVDLPALSEALAARLFAHTDLEIDPALMAVGAGA
jgi:two-component system chemotaxis sensor kinase CheA